MSNNRIHDFASGFAEGPYDRLMRDALGSFALDEARRKILAIENVPELVDARAKLDAIMNTPQMLEAHRAVASLQDRIASDPVWQQARAMADEYERRQQLDPGWIRLQAELATARETFYAQMAIGEADKTYGRLLHAGVVPGSLRSTVDNMFGPNAHITGSVLGDHADLIARANQWAGVLGASPADRIAGLFPGGAIGQQVEDMHRRASELIAASGPSSAQLSATLGLAVGYDDHIATTRLKLAALAGTGDLFGASTGANLSAYENLFGEWRTRPDLPERFWRDPATRRRMYRDAEVDPGLVDAEVGVALEVAVESGFSSGFRAESGAVAIVPVGRLVMSIRSVDTRIDTYQALGAFEEELRDFIARKLSARAGPQWFKQRVDGVTAGRAKEVRATAIRQGEDDRHLIHFAELGDLKNIVMRKDNWGEVFEQVFVNQSRFDHDMGTLISTRRPTMHFRKIDGVRMLEALCVIDRLTKQMRNDGAWQDSEEIDD